MQEIMNGYELLEPFKNKNAGFSRWTYAIKDNKEYFLKEFLNPVYPREKSISSDLRKRCMRDCEEYQLKKKHLYEEVNNVSDGNLVRIFEFFRCDSHYYISTEKIQECKSSFKDIAEKSLEDRILLCKTVAHSVKKLHQAHIVHADIKDSNILIKQTETGKLIGKIIDYDCSFFEDDPPQDEDELGGDQVYLAPEACQFICGDSVKLTCKMDVFALGILFHQYLTGVMPIFDTDEYKYIFEVVLEEQPVQVSDALTLELQKMLTGMLEKDPEKRLSIEEVYEILEKLSADSEKEEAGNVEKSEKNWFFNGGDL